MHNMGKWPIGLYEKALPLELSWEERLSQAAIAGYDFLEMSIDESDQRQARLEWTPSRRREMRRSIENTGIPILTMGVSAHRKFPLGSASPQVRAKGLDMLCRAIELAFDLGVRVIQLMGYDVYYEDSNEATRQRYLEGLSQGASRASAAGVMLGLENVDVETVDSAEKALRFVQAVSSPWLNVFPDIGNMAAAGYDPVEQLRLVKNYLVGIHVKDALPGEVRGVPFEHGIVPFQEVFRTLTEMDYCGPLVVEMWAHLDPIGDPLRSAAQARQLVSRLVQQAGDFHLEEKERN
jgi:L-ribulose-5-phosphate 3-epimerase